MANAIVVIAASAGGLEPLLTIVRALPEQCSASVFVVMHIGAHRSVLPDLLREACPLHAGFARDGDPIEGGRIYVAPPDHHMTLELHQVRLDRGEKVHNTRPAADPLFASAARTFGKRVIGIVLSGGGWDGAEGLRIVKQRGGLAWVQSPEDAFIPTMPIAAIEEDHPDAHLTSVDIATRLRMVLSIS